MKTPYSSQLLLSVALALAALGGGCLGIGGKKKAPDTNASAEPDKVLYDRALDDFKHGRFTVSRLTLQTLINTYPDSEYLAKAKLAIADSYYKEGGTEGLTQSVAEYKDFITFFPFLDEAPYAQLQVAMAHYRLMEKPDRDRTEARSAEDELQTFLLKFPQSPLDAQAEQRLREVQETLAEGDFRVARYYYLKQSYRAAAARLLTLTDRYPLYSQSDHALWMLGNIYDHAEKRAFADRYYAQLVRDHPSSSLVGAAKKKLLAAGVPVPQPDPNALARMQEEQKYAKDRPGILRRSLGFITSSPDLSSSAHSGKPTLSPETEGVSAVDVLRPGGSPGAVSAGSGGTAGSAVSIETVPPDSSAANPSATAPPDSANGGDAPAPVPGVDAATPATSNPAEAIAAANVIGGKSTYTDAVANGKIPEGSAPPPAAGPPGTTAPGDTQATQAKPAPKADPKTESTSKKKKGLRKLIPW